MWLLASACSTAAGPTVDDLWTALNADLGNLANENYRWSTRAPFHQRINDELDRVFAAVKIPDGKLGVILASTKGYVEDIVGQSLPSANDPVTPVLKEFLARHSLNPERSVCVSNACASSHAAVYLARMWLRRALVDHVLILSVDTVGPFVSNGFKSLGLVSPDYCRPFSEGRAGLRLGEAAVAMVLSDKQKSSIEIESVAIDSEGSPVSRPLSSGRSLQRVGIAVLAGGRPDVIVAHGTGTQLNDLIEDQTFTALFNEPNTAHASPPITGTKWCVGHTLGASGAVDIVAASEILRHQQIFPIASTVTPDPALHGKFVLGRSIQKPVDRVFVNSLGFGGTHAALMLRRHT